jgi:hypothetical protein
MRPQAGRSTAIRGRGIFPSPSDRSVLRWRPQAFGREAATVAIEYDGVGDLMRMWADARDDADRMAIILDIEKLIDDIKRVYAHEWYGAHLSSDARALATYMSDLSEEFWCAGWMRDLEFMLWSVIEGEEADASLTLTRDQLATLKSLSNACKGWIVFRRNTQKLSCRCRNGCNYSPPGSGKRALRTKANRNDTTDKKRSHTRASPGATQEREEDSRGIHGLGRARTGRAKQKCFELQNAFPLIIMAGSTGKF